MRRLDQNDDNRHLTSMVQSTQDLSNGDPQEVYSQKISSCPHSLTNGHQRQSAPLDTSVGHSQRSLQQFQVRPEFPWLRTPLVLNQSSALPHKTNSNKNTPAAYQGSSVQFTSVPNPRNSPTPSTFQKNLPQDTSLLSSVPSPRNSPTSSTYHRDLPQTTDTSLFDSIEAFCEDINIEEIQLDDVIVADIVSKTTLVSNISEDCVADYDPLLSTDYSFEGASLEVVGLSQTAVRDKFCNPDSLSRKRQASETLPVEHHSCLQLGLTSKGTVFKSLPYNRFLCESDSNVSTPIPSKSVPCKRVAPETSSCDSALYGTATQQAYYHKLIDYESTSCEGPFSEVELQRVQVSPRVPSTHGNRNRKQFETFHNRKEEPAFTQDLHIKSNPFKLLAYETLVRKCLSEASREVVPEIFTLRRNSETDRPAKGSFLESGSFQLSAKYESVDQEEMKNDAEINENSENQKENNVPGTGSTTNTGKLDQSGVDQHEDSAKQPELSTSENIRPDALTNSLGYAESLYRVTNVHYENVIENNLISEHQSTERPDGNDQRRLKIKVCDLIDCVIDSTLSEQGKL